MTTQVKFTKASLELLREAYEKAVKDGSDTFKFDGNEYFVGYAKYLLEYLKTRLG